MSSKYFGIIAITLAFAIIVITISNISAQSANLPDGIPRGAQSAIFAGGCFWCTEATLQEIDGVYTAISGYTGGHLENPTYQQVLTGTTGHVEAVKIYYNPREVSYEEILDEFLFSIDPTDDGGQFSDRGESYQTVIFYHSNYQKDLAEDALKKLEGSGIYDEEIKVAIRQESEFYQAEEYHQDYYLKDPRQYKNYYRGSGREAFVNKARGAISNN